MIEKLRRVFDPADLKATGFVDRLRIEEGDVPIPFQEKLSRRLWYRIGFRRGEQYLRERQET